MLALWHYGNKGRNRFEVKKVKEGKTMAAGTVEQF